MFKETKDNFYKSLSNSIKNRIIDLKLKGREILNDAGRVSKIVSGYRNHYPYLICSGEYPRLNFLFSCEDYNSFIVKNDLNDEPKELIKRYGNNYDKMLWRHIDWDKMFQDAITELSEYDILENLEKLKNLKNLKKLGELKKQEELEELEEQEKLIKLFEDTLIDYAPYALIRYDELDFNYARIFIFPEERKGKRQKAIERVHLGHGSEVFKQTFLEKFSGKTLREFDKGFSEFISDYLKKRKPDNYSLGLQAYKFHKNLSEYVVDWQKRLDVQFDDESDEKSILLGRYIRYGREQMQKLKEYQQEFDNLAIDIE